VATEAAWLNGNPLEKETIKKKKEKMKERLDTHRPSHGRSYIGRQFDSDLATAFMESLPASYLQAEAFLIAASALNMGRRLPASSRQQ
jgi:hypothetical protein